jgi:hypothetical protein
MHHIQGCIWVSSNNIIIREEKRRETLKAPSSFYESDSSCVLPNLRHSLRWSSLIEGYVAGVMHALLAKRSLLLQTDAAVYEMHVYSVSYMTAWMDLRYRAAFCCSLFKIY